MANVTETLRKINFIEKTLPSLIVERNEEFKDFKVINCRAELNKHLDGFMSVIYNVQLTMQGPNEETPQVHNIILKIMKGDESFREFSKSTPLFMNEVHVYKNILPFFKKYLKDNNVTFFNPDEWWSPRAYFADYGIFPELSESVETVIAIENLKISGYRMGPKIDLDEDHLRFMIKNIAFYHSVSYALKIRKDPMLAELAGNLAPFPFLSPSGEEFGFYKRLLTVGMQRFFTLVETNPSYKFSENFLSNVKKFKEKVFTNPLVLMEKFLNNDEVFSLILHGDYQKNNVMFKYNDSQGFDNPKGIKMYDFQKIRYASPVIDIAIFLYMNLHYTKREKLWDLLIQYYHDNLIESLTHILKCGKDDVSLEPYSFKNFIQHFGKHAFYCVMICLHFVPWIACPEEELQQIAHWFETDINSEEFFKITQICGGEDVDKRILNIVKHASDKGYMNII